MIGLNQNTEKKLDVLAYLSYPNVAGESLRNCQSLYLKMKDEIFVGRRPYSEEIIEKFLRMHFGGTTTMAELGSKKYGHFS